MANLLPQLYAEMREFHEHLKRIQEEKRIDEAVESVVELVSIFDGYDPEGYLGCYEEEMKQFKVDEVKMIEVFVDMVISDFVARIHELQEKHRYDWFNFKKAIIQECWDDSMVEDVMGHEVECFFKVKGEGGDEIEVDLHETDAYGYEGQATLLAQEQVSLEVVHDYACTNDAMLHEGFQQACEIDSKEVCYMGDSNNDVVLRVACQDYSQVSLGLGYLGMPTECFKDKQGDDMSSVLGLQSKQVYEHPFLAWKPTYGDELEKEIDSIFLRHEKFYEK